MYVDTETMNELGFDLLEWTGEQILEIHFVAAFRAAALISSMTKPLPRSRSLG